MPIYEYVCKKKKCKQKEPFEKLREVGKEGFVYKVIEISAVIAGLFLIVSSLDELIFPDSRKYINFIFILFAVSIFAASGAFIIISVL